MNNADWYLYERADREFERVKIEKYGDWTNCKGYYILGVYPEDGFACGIRDLTDEQYHQIVKNGVLEVKDVFGSSDNSWSIKKIV